MKKLKENKAIYIGLSIIVIWMAFVMLYIDSEPSKIAYGFINNMQGVIERVDVINFTTKDIEVSLIVDFRKTSSIYSGVEQKMGAIVYEKTNRFFKPYYKSTAVWMPENVFGKDGFKAATNSACVGTENYTIYYGFAPEGYSEFFVDRIKAEFKEESVTIDGKTKKFVIWYLFEEEVQWHKVLTYKNDYNADCSGELSDSKTTL